MSAQTPRIPRHPGSGLEQHTHGPERPTTAHLWTDASFKKGAMGLGIVLQAHETPLITWTVRCKEDGRDSTHAELHALHFALQQAARLGHTAVVLHTDASMAIWHAAGNSTTYDVMPALQAALQSMDHVRMQWVPRERNELANALSRVALNLPYSYTSGLALRAAPIEKILDWSPSM